MTSSTATPSPDDINTMFASACEYQTRQEYDKAKALYLTMLEHVDGPLLRYNLGLLYFDLMDFSKAKEQFEIGIRMQPEDQDMLFNLAISHKASGDINSAIASYHQLLDLNDSHIDALYNLGSCYRESGKTESAIKYYTLVLQLDPQNGSATNNLAFTLHLAGDMDNALHYYRQLLKLRPGHGSAAHMIAALEGNTPDQPPDEYVRDVFDSYSATYEESLTHNLDYSVPEKIRAMLDALPDTPEVFYRGVDLGCGTGLSGLAFKNMVNEFHGIDLSPKMIDLAREKNIYTSLFAGNILDTLREKADSELYDFILAADVFTYIGELGEIFKTLKVYSLPSSLFCFSTEKTETGPFILSPSGRYAHAQEYIQKVLEKNGWQLLVCEDADLRKEKGDWVKGNLWIARRSN